MIVGKNINLRVIKECDLDELLGLNSDISERGDYDSLQLPSEPIFKSRFKENGIWTEDFGTMLITDKAWEILGDITYFKGLKYCEGYEIGYRLFRKENRGKGYMTEALKLFSAYMFSIKPIARLQVNCFCENAASRRTAEKCGFKYEGTMRKAVFCKGKYYDLDLLSIMREECPDFSEVIKSL
ncbi:MAG: GNAT family N-acetyltransferase [Clostridia bacterium]